MNKKLVVVLLVVLVFSLAPTNSSSAAAVFTEQTGSNNPFNGVDAGSDSAPTFVDLDADGDFDCVIGNENGLFLYYENIGNPLAPNFIELTDMQNPLDGFDATWHSTPAFVDIDSDGDMDLFSGREDGTITIFENTGDAENPNFIHPTGSNNPLDHVDVGANSAPVFLDLDKDGDMDVLIGAYQSRIYLGWNTGSALEAGFGEPELEIELQGINYLVPSPSDLDLDGDYDLVIGTNLGNTQRENVGDANFRSWRQWDPFFQSAANYAKPVFVDIDGDGDEDAFVGNNVGTIKYFKNTGNNKKLLSLNTVHSSFNPFDGIDVGTYSKPAFVDIDGDGDQDTFFGESNGRFSYYENTGMATFPVATQRLGLFNPLDGRDVGAYSAPVFADIDGDGDQDLFSGELLNGITYYENTGNVVTATFTLRTGSANPLNFDPGAYSVPALVDIDADNDLDAFVGDFSGAILHYRNTGSDLDPQFAAYYGTLNPLNAVAVNGESSVAFCDGDRDGDMDAFIGSNAGTLDYYENTGNPMQPAFTAVAGKFAIDVGTSSFPAMVDIDHDGDCDAFVGDFYGMTQYFENFMHWLFLPLGIR